MLEYFTYKKFKKNKEAKKASEEEYAQKNEASSRNETPSSGTTPKKEQQTELVDAEGSLTPPPAHLAGRPVLDRADESFLQNLLSEDGPAPPLPPRVTMPELDWPSDDASSIHRPTSINESAPAVAPTDTAATATSSKDQGESREPKEAAAKKSNRLSQVFSRVGKKKPKHGDSLKPDDAKDSTSAEEVDKETRDLTRVLDRLNLSATTSGNGSTVHSKVTALTDDSAEVLRSFTQIFKDLANGVPTAYDDLVQLIKDRDGAITKGFEKLPKGLQKLVTQLPDKITTNIAPEVLAAAAKSQGVEAAEHMLSPQNIFKLMTEPGALVAMLRAIVSTLQQRWPAFIGVNVLWSVALALLMFVLWYCYKRGREERMGKENLESETATAEGSERLDGLAPPAVVSPDHRLESRSASSIASSPPPTSGAQNVAK